MSTSTTPFSTAIDDEAATYMATSSPARAMLPAADGANSRLSEGEPINPMSGETCSGGRSMRPSWHPRSDLTASSSRPRRETQSGSGFWLHFGGAIFPTAHEPPAIAIAQTASSAHTSGLCSC
jgi:hypothetical protein